MFVFAMDWHSNNSKHNNLGQSCKFISSTKSEVHARNPLSTVPRKFKIYWLTIFCQNKLSIKYLHVSRSTELISNKDNERI